MIIIHLSLIKSWIRSLSQEASCGYTLDWMQFHHNTLLHTCTHRGTIPSRRSTFWQVFGRWEETGEAGATPRHK